MDLIEEPAPGNSPEYTVSDISGAVKRLIEGEFTHVRVRGEVGRVVLARTGHLYFDLKDDRNVLAAVSWKGQAARLSHRPEEGMEVIATGRLTTFGPQSKYQLVVDELVPAGAGALMAMLEKLKARLAAEGLFAPERKRPIPYLPEVIGVVTSPTGAVIRDILHRLRERFPRHVLIWPVAVQGEKCAAEVAAAIQGFNALKPGGRVPRPNLIIVARGGGSVEDLWGFNEEVVVRAAVASEIPLISAVGHETDTTLIDHAADLRAPTPTAAAELAVPVRLELLARVGELAARLVRGTNGAAERRREQLRDLGRGLGRPEARLETPRQRLDGLALRLPLALRAMTERRRGQFARSDALIRPAILDRFIAGEGRRVQSGARSLQAALQRLNARAENTRATFVKLGVRLDAAPWARTEILRQRLAALDRTRRGLGHAETLRRGFAVVRGATGELVLSRAAATVEARLELEFRDGRIAVKPDEGSPAHVPARGTRQKRPPPGQGSLF